MMTAVDVPSMELPWRSHRAGPTACGNVLTGVERNLKQPAVDPARGRWLMLDGEIWDVEGLKDSLRGHGVDGEGLDDAELALLAWAHLGEDFYKRMNGAWNLVMGEGDRCQIVTDRLGSRLLMFAHDGRRVVFANELKGVVAGRAQPSRPGGAGLYALLHASSHYGDETWVEGVQLVRPGTVLTLEGGRLSERRYNRLHFAQRGEWGRPEDASADDLAALLKRATARMFKDAPALSGAITLSGGLDSRAVALSIDPDRRPLTAITYGDPDSADVRYARELAGVLGLSHLYIEPELDGLLAAAKRTTQRLTGSEAELGFYSAQLDRVLWSSEALSPLDETASPIWHPIYRRHMRFMLNGAAGDALTGSHLTPDMLAFPSRQGLIRQTFNRCFTRDPTLVASVLNPRFSSAHQGSLLSRFSRSFDGIVADHPMSAASTWDMEQRQRRGAFASFVMERYFCSCRSPFLDYDVVNFLAGLPPRWRFQQRLYKRMFVRCFPQAAHVPWAYTGGKIHSSPVYEFGREALNFGRRKLKARLSPNVGTKAHHDFRDAIQLMRQDRALGQALLDATEAEDFPAEVFDRDGVRALVREFWAEGDAARGGLFSHLIGILRANQLFLSDRDISMPATADPVAFGVSAAV